jgi:dTDP-4-dehydrorhamnose 3,5-epimerase
MKIRLISTRIHGVSVIKTDVFRDERGFFIESYHRQRYEEHGIPDEFVQDNHSRSAKNVLRGFHFQDQNAPMGKLVRCTRGAILDVFVDLRVGSPTFGQWDSVRLSEENMLQVFLPPWCGHAFVTLSDSADVQYKCTSYYTPSAEGTIAWNDPDINVDWPVKEPIISRRDQYGLSLKAYLSNPSYSYERPEQ